jgi:colicin import membrane protein
MRFWRRRSADDNKQNTMNTLELTANTKGNAVATTETVNVDQLDTAKPLAEIFKPFETVLNKWEEKAAALVVTDINQVTEMKQARLARLELKEARVNMDKTRKSMVEGLKARTAKIDGVARVIREKIEDLESRLLESEQFAERHAAKLKAELKLKRESELVPFLDSPLLIDLSDLTDDQYASALSDAKALRQAKIDAALKAEQERKAKEEADRIERERLAAENARLQAEALAAAKAAEEERQRVEKEREIERKKAAAEAKRLADIARKEREEIEAKAKAEAEKAAAEAAKLKEELAAKERVAQAEQMRFEKERIAKEQAERAAAAAPDKAKLAAFAATIRGLKPPAVTNTEIANAIMSQVEAFAVWVEKQATKL